MTRKLRFAIGITVLICLTLSAYLAYSHDVFYPHHRDDLRKEEMRLTVLFITAGFVILLGAIFYMVLRSEKQESQRTHESEQERLEEAANRAAQVSYATLLEGETAEAAIHAALAAYAKHLDVVWNPTTVLVDGDTIRCHIGGDVVVIKILHQMDKYEIEVHASRDEVTVVSVQAVVRDE